MEVTLAIMLEKMSRMQEEIVKIKKCPAPTPSTKIIMKKRRRAHDLSINSDSDVGSAEAEDLLELSDQVYSPPRKSAKYVIPRAVPATTVVEEVDNANLEGQEDIEEGEISLQTLMKEFEPDVEVGPELNPNIVSFIEKAFDQPNEAKMAEIADRLLKPANLNIDIQKVNPVVWERLPMNSQILDARVQRIMKNDLKVAYLLADIIQNMDQSKNTEFLKPVMEAVAILGANSYSVKEARKVNLQRGLNPKFKAALNTVNEGDCGKTEFLFGDKLGETVKLMEESDKLKVNLSRQSKNSGAPRSGRDAPYRPEHYHNRGQYNRETRGKFTPYQNRSSYQNRDSYQNRSPYQNKTSYQNRATYQNRNQAYRGKYNPRGPRGQSRRF
jgi:hypothetical protein